MAISEIICREVHHQRFSVFSKSRLVVITYKGIQFGTITETQVEKACGLRWRKLMSTYSLGQQASSSNLSVAQVPHLEITTVLSS